MYYIYNIYSTNITTFHPPDICLGDSLCILLQLLFIEIWDLIFMLYSEVCENDYHKCVKVLVCSVYGSHINVTGIYNISSGIDSQATYCFAIKNA